MIALSQRQIKKLYYLYIINALYAVTDVMTYRAQNACLMLFNLITNTETSRMDVCVFDLPKAM